MPAKFSIESNPTGRDGSVHQKSGAFSHARVGT